MVRWKSILEGTAILALCFVAGLDINHRGSINSIMGEYLVPVSGSALTRHVLSANRRGYSRARSYCDGVIIQEMAIVDFHFIPNDFHRLVLFNTAHQGERDKKFI